MRAPRLAILAVTSILLLPGTVVGRSEAQTGPAQTTSSCTPRERPRGRPSSAPGRPCDARQGEPRRRRRDRPIDEHDLPS